MQHKLQISKDRESVKTWKMSNGEWHRGENKLDKPKRLKGDSLGSGRGMWVSKQWEIGSVLGSLESQWKETRQSRRQEQCPKIFLSSGKKWWKWWLSQVRKMTAGKGNLRTSKEKVVRLTTPLPLRLQHIT